MSKLLKYLCLSLLLAMTVSAKANSIENSTSFSSDNDPTSEISRRLAGLELPLTTKASDAHLQRKINDYLDKGSHSTERMLGRANQYFPVFEYYLQKHDMPESLKYLAVAESMLVPGAVSSARAAGLWQLMPSTARAMGLRVDGVVDERLDIYRSTEAAVIMLKALHKQFGDWHLAMAAYNCGPGRVRRAIRAAGGHTYYPKVRRFLPKESQKYVAAYVAAAYTVNYYDDYGLTPASFLLEDSVASLTVYRSLNLRRMAKACDIPVAQVYKMNPSFVKAYVPRNRSGYRLRVPLEYKFQVQEYVWGQPNLVELPQGDDPKLAALVANDLGFDARSWLTGCYSHKLLSQPSIKMDNQINNWNLKVEAEYRAVAML